MHPDAGLLPDGDQLLQASRPPPRMSEGARHTAGPPPPAAGRCQRPPQCCRTGSAGNPARWTARPPRPSARPRPAAARRPVRRPRAAPGARPTRLCRIVPCDARTATFCVSRPDTASRYSATLNDAGGFQSAVDRREVLVQVPRGLLGSADPRFPVLANDEGRHPLGQRPEDPAAAQQRPLGVRVRVDEPWADHAACRQVDHVAVRRRTRRRRPHRGDGLAPRSARRRAASWRQCRRRPFLREARSV